MPRLKQKTIEDGFYDVFADWDMNDQAIALRVLTALHRQARRDAHDRKLATDPPQQTLPETEEGD